MVSICRLPLGRTVLFLCSGSCVHGEFPVCKLGHPHVDADILQLYRRRDHEGMEIRAAEYLYCTGNRTDNPDRLIHHYNIRECLRGEDLAGGAII